MGQIYHCSIRSCVVIFGVCSGSCQYKGGKGRAVQKKAIANNNDFSDAAPRSSRADKFLAVLGSATRALLAEAALDQVLPTILEALTATPDVLSVAYLATTDADKLNLRTAGDEKLAEMLRHYLEQDEFCRRDVFEPGQATVLNKEEVSTWLPESQSAKDSYSLALASAHIDSRRKSVLAVSIARDPLHWRNDELEALVDIAVCLEKAQANREWRTAVDARLSHQQALIEASLAVSESLDLRTVLNRLAEKMAQAIDATSVFLSDWNEEAGEVTVIAEYHSKEAGSREQVSALGNVYHPGEEFGDDMQWLTKGQLKLSRRSDPDLNEAERAMMQKRGVRSSLVVPFRVEGRIVGYAVLWESRYERTFTAEEIALCNGMARQGAIAFENARLYEEVRQRANELELVHQVAIATASLVDIDRLLQETTSFVCERIYPDVFGFVLRDEESGQFKPHSSYHGLPPRGLETTVPVESSVCGRVVRTAKPLIIDDVSQEPLYFPIVEETRSEIAVPLVSDDKVIGVINVESRKRSAFSASDLRFLTTLAGQVVTAIERARLYEDLEKHAEKLAEEVEHRTLELKWERDRMLAILDSAGEGILFTDVNANILYVNPAFEKQTGYAREECLGMTPRMWRSDETKEDIISDMWKTLMEGERWRGELINRRKDGSHFDAALTITPLIDNEGELMGFVGVQADISRLKEVDRLKSKFIANVSHELRTPLTNIRTYISLMERGDTGRRKRYMTVIKQESERLTRLIQDLLDLSRLEAQGQPSELKQIDVRNLIRTALDAFWAQAERKEIAVSSQVYGPLPAIYAPPLQLQQVLSNLVANALAYTPRGGRVQVSAGSEEQDGRTMLWLRVEDNGPGVKKTEIPRLFERFYRGEAARRSGAPGTGLGLAISKEIVERCGGQLVLDSVPGEGSLFTVWYPVTESGQGNRP